MRFIDTHCHLFWEDFTGDIEQVLERAFEAGVSDMLVPATDFKTLQQALDLSRRFEHVFASAGIHPHDAAELPGDYIDRLKEAAGEEAVGEEAVLAIGEIGLDYHYDFCPRPKQQEVLHAQLELAAGLDLPVIIHNRESDEDLYSILREHQDGTLRGQFHCFSSGPEYAERVLDIGFHISFTGNVTFKKSTLDEVLALVPDDRLLIETDSPFMSPMPFRGKRNEPMRIPLIAERFATARGQSIEHIAEVTTGNALELYGFAERGRSRAEHQPGSRGINKP